MDKARKAFSSLVLGGSILGLACLAGVTNANADTMLFDRGLPTANLNTSTSPRSNVLWADWEATSVHSTFYQPGDDFTLAGIGPYQVNTIRVWSTDNTGLSLLGGLAGGSIVSQSSTYTSTLVTSYDGGLGYKGNSGAYRDVYQIDFGVSIALNAGDTYQFFLDGPAAAYDGGGYVNSFLHASDKDTSGSTQQGADDTFLWLNGGTVYTWNSGTGVGSLCPSIPCAGDNHPSDGNVQVFGAPIPEPETYAMMLAGLGLMGFIARRRKQKLAAA